MYFNDAVSQLQNTVKFMGRPIEYVDSTDLLGASVTSRIRGKNVNSSVPKFYCRVNSVLYDFKDIPCDVKAKLPGACPGIRFFAFQFFRGGPAPKIAEKMIFSTKEVAKYR